jgi:GT2 family glycosyltransferase
MTCSIVICTYQRAEMCREAVRRLLGVIGARDEIIVVDQAPEEPGTPETLAGLGADNRLRYFRQSRPDLVRARNHGVQMAKGDIVLFVDDDVIPSPDLVKAHLAAYVSEETGAVAGRVVTAGIPPADVLDPRALDPVDGCFYTNFDHREPAVLLTARGCNMSFRRSVLIGIGGSDTHFRPPFAFREDSDACLRVRALGYRLVFAPEAELVHLEAPRGGTRVPARRRSGVGRELHSYRRYFFHYRDNLYFLCRHFRGAGWRRWLWRSYRAYVGCSRWPWRLVAKNLCFLAALLQARWWSLTSRPPYFEPPLTDPPREG